MISTILDVLADEESSTEEGCSILEEVTSSDFSDFEGVSDTSVGLLDVSDVAVAELTVSDEEPDFSDDVKDVAVVSSELSVFEDAWGALEIVVDVGEADLSEVSVLDGISDFPDDVEDAVDGPWLVLSVLQGFFDLWVLGGFFDFLDFSISTDVEGFWDCLDEVIDMEGVEEAISDFSVLDDFRVGDSTVDVMSVSEN